MNGERKMNETKVIINKGNYDIEPDERIKHFEYCRGYGWEEDYKNYRKKWCEYPEKKYVSEYPLLVDIELSTICNLKCPMCYTISDEFGKLVEKKLMDFNLYKKIIDEIKGKVPAIRLSLRGESTIHPDLIKCVHYAKESGIPEVSMLTNCSLMEPEFFEKLLLAGIDWITVSIDGQGVVYEKIRYPLKFEDTLKKIKLMKEIKLKYDSKRPVIKIQSIWPAIMNDAEKFYNLFSPFVDLIAYNPLVDFDIVEQVLEMEDFACPQPYQRLVVSSNGKVLQCACGPVNDEYIGDINTESVYDVWHGEKLNNLREKHKEIGGFKELKYCKNCFLSKKVIDSCSIKINEREIIIKDYAKQKSNK